jgi:hypothetical protein
MDASMRDRCGIPLSDMLRIHELSPEEIDAIVEAADPEIVRRYLELHRERLQERLDERLRALDALETHLTNGGSTGSGITR